MNLNSQIILNLSEACGNFLELPDGGAVKTIEFPNLFRLAFKQFLWDPVATGEHTTYLNTGKEKFHAPFNSMSSIANFMGKCGLVFAQKTNIGGNEVQAFLCSLADVHMSFTSDDYERFQKCYKKAKMNPVYISCAVISAAPTPKKVVKSNNGRPKKKAKAEDLAVVQVIVLDEVKCAAYVDGKKQKMSFFKVLVPNSLSALVQVYEDVQLRGDVGYLPSKWVAFMRRLNPSLHYCVDKQEEFGKLTMVLNVLVCVNSVLSWDVSRFVVAAPNPQLQNSNGIAIPQYGPEMPPYTAPPGFQIVRDLATFLDTNTIVDGGLKGRFICYKFDAPVGWQLCHILKSVKNNETFNYMLHTCSDREQIYVALDMDMYSFALEATSSSWCLLRRLVPTPAGFVLVQHAKPTEICIQEGYLLGRKVMFNFTTGWTSASITKFKKTNEALPYSYEMLCDDDGAIIRVLFQLQKYSIFVDSELGSWCLLSENLKSDS